MDYKLKEFFFSVAEIRFYEALKQVVGNKYLIFPKVRIADLVESSDLVQFNKVRGKHIDFTLLESGRKIKVKMLIELDDKTHNEPKRQTRDLEIDALFKAVGLPIAHIKVKPEYDLEEIRRILKFTYNKSRRSKNSLSDLAVTLTADIPKPGQSNYEKQKEGL